METATVDLTGFTLGEKVALRRLLWEEMSRPDQLLPEGDWLACWLAGGRGSGKTRAGAEGAAQLAFEFPKVNGAIVAPTFQADALRKCIEGKSGILRALQGMVEDYNRSEGVIYLKSGASIFATGSDNGALRIQGENLGWCWCDEIGLWRRTAWQRAWEESIQFAVREEPSKIICTGTPKAGHPLVKLLEDDPAVPKRRLLTKDNVANLSADWVARIIGKYQGTRLGAQELEGLVIPEVEGALWRWEWLDGNNRRMHTAPVMVRLVVGVDPSGGANEIGIIAAGKIKSPCPCGEENQQGPHFAVVEDGSMIGSPEQWGRKAVTVYHDRGADRLAAERNFGGDMVESTVRTADRRVPVKMVNASRGKMQRAEPVSAVYEQRRVHHVGMFPELEAELTSWVPGDDWSPNRLDALVWALTELGLESGSGGGMIRERKTTSI